MRNFKVRKNDYYLIRVNKYILNFDPEEQSLNFINMMFPYNSETLARLSFSDENEILVNYYDGEKNNITPLSLEMTDIFFKHINIENKIFSLNPDVKLLSQDWSKYDDINDFLDFFIDGSYLCFTGEYGNEMVCFLPFIAYLISANLLHNRFIQTYSGMFPYYYFVSKNNYMEASRKRKYIL